MPWANRSSAHELQGGISVKTTRNVIMHDEPNCYFLPFFYLLKLGLLHFSQIAPCHSTFLSFTTTLSRKCIHMQMSNFKLRNYALHYVNI